MKLSDNEWSRRAVRLLLVRACLLASSAWRLLALAVQAR